MQRQELFFLAMLLRASRSDATHLYWIAISFAFVIQKNSTNNVPIAALMQ